VAEGREKRIMGVRCDIYWVEWSKCEWSEVHFSREDQWIKHWNEVL